MLPERYNIDNLQRTVHNPHLFIEELQRVIPNPIYKLNNALFYLKHGDGIDVPASDWDNLIILDACRYDYFERVNDIPGELKPVVSKGGHSWAFMDGNFVGRELHDTVYVTANPHVEKLAEDTFYTVENLLDEWDEDIKTVRPEDVSAAAIEANDRYPNKRLIIHFMQPHTPYIGPTADEIRKRITLDGWEKYRGTDINIEDDSRVDIWDVIKQGEVTHGELERLYVESLEAVLKHVKQVVNEINGKTVVTADHGEMLGERVLSISKQRYGHPHDIQTPELRIVPWLTIESDERRKTKSQEPIGFDRISEETVNERLVALGYKPE